VQAVSRSREWAADPKNETPGKTLPPHDAALGKELSFRGKVKLHGTCCGVTVQKGGLRVQSRTVFLDGKAQAGEIVFASKQSSEYFQSLFRPSDGYELLTIFGEWAGPGVQKGVALASLKQKIFAVFAVQLDQRLLFEPQQIVDFLTKKGTAKLPDRLYVLPWETEPFALRLDDEKSLQEPVENLNALVDKIDREDPWVLKTFGVKGNGEGLVLYPSSLAAADGSLDVALFETFAFKAKGEAHRVVKTEKSVQAKPAVAESAEKLADFLLPDARLEQGATAVGGFDKKNLARFIFWLKNDVEKEGKDELAASKLEWKAVHPFISKKASAWFSKQCVRTSTPDKESKKESDSE